MEDCLFCKIATGKIPSAKVMEDTEFLAFLDISPANKGHTLVIPKVHHETFIDMSPLLLSRYMLFVQDVAGKINKNLEPDGYNVFMNNKHAAGQMVPHAHFHIVPRWKGDGISFSWSHKKYAEGELASIASKITGNDRD
jgi:histidine triad (HIT) family protein